MAVEATTLSYMFWTTKPDVLYGHSLLSHLNSCNLLMYGIIKEKVDYQKRVDVSEGTRTLEIQIQKLIE